MTEETILKSILYLHRWMFFKRWLPITNETLIKYFYPKEDWVIFEVEVQETP
jgi:hypothetical protein